MVVYQVLYHPRVAMRCIEDVRPAHVMKCGLWVNETSRLSRYREAVPLTKWTKAARSGGEETGSALPEAPQIFDQWSAKFDPKWQDRTKQRHSTTAASENRCQNRSCIHNARFSPLYRCFETSVAYRQEISPCPSPHDSLINTSLYAARFVSQVWCNSPVRHPSVP